MCQREECERREDGERSIRGVIPSGGGFLSVVVYKGSSVCLVPLCFLHLLGDIVHKISFLSFSSVLN